jgi:hypothetical protein
MSDEPLPNSEIILYQTEDGRTRVQCRFENETVWLTQALLAELFEIGVNTVNYHLKAIFAEGELRPEATIRYYRIVRTEGKREVTREQRMGRPFRAWDFLVDGTQGAALGCRMIPRWGVGKGTRRAIEQGEAISDRLDHEGPMGKRFGSGHGLSMGTADRSPPLLGDEMGNL